MEQAAGHNRTQHTEPDQPAPSEPSLRTGENPQGSSGGSGLTRVTVNLTRPAVQALESISDSTGYSKTDTINRALLVYSIIQDIMEKNAGVLRVRHQNGELERIHIL